MRSLVSSVAGPGTRQRILLSAAVDRFVAPLAGGPPPGLRRGMGVPRRQAAVVLVVLHDPDQVGLERLLGELAAIVERPGSATPVLVTRPVWWPFVRRAGFVVEQLFDDPVRRADSLEEMRRTYACDEVTDVWPDDDPSTALGPLARVHPPVSPVRRLLRLLEAWADPGPTR